MFFKRNIIKIEEDSLIKNFKSRFGAVNRRLFHARKRHIVNSINCHAVGGTLETNLLWLRDSIVGLNKPTLLNLGGGVGDISTMIRDIGYDVYNVDIEIGNSDERNFSFDLNSTDELPLENEFFDVVFCQEIIEHIENPWSFFRRAFWHLKPGGTMIVTTPNVLSLKSRKIFKRSGYFHHFMPKNFSYHINPIPYWEMELIAGKTGFVLGEVKGNSEYYFGRMDKDSIIKNSEILIFYFKKPG